MSKKFLKRSLFLFLILVLTFSSMSVAKTKADLPDVLIEPFPILTWVPPAINAQQLGWFEEAGFTVLNIYPDEKKYQTMKKYWDGNFIMFNAWSEYTYEDMLRFHPEDEKKIGYLFGDEPLYDEIDDYTEIFERVKKQDPERVSLVNLFPSYVGQTRLGSHFIDYVKHYFDTLQPRYCSLDNYPLLWFDVELPNYYSDIELMQRFSKWNDSKQIGFVQLYSSKAKRDVSESDVMWQVNSLLAYGCKGLWYFNFRHPSRGLSRVPQPEISEEGVKDFRRLPNQWSEYYKPVYKNFNGSSALGLDDKPSFAFDYVKKANAQVLAWGPTLLKLKNTAVRHIINRQPFVPVGTAEFVKNGEPFIKNINAADVDEDQGYIVSYFDGEQGDKYVMIVNKRHGEFMSCEGGKTKTIILFDKTVDKLHSVSPEDGSLEEVKFEDQKLVTDLDAGGAILFKVQ